MTYLQEFSTSKKITIHESFLKLNEVEIKILLAIWCLKDRNNLVPFITNKTLLELTRFSRSSYLRDGLKNLITNGWINVEGDYSKAHEALFIKCLDSNTKNTRYGIVRADVVLSAIQDLTFKELQILVAYYTFLDYKAKNNYVFPMNKKIIDKVKIDRKYFEDCKFKLLEKGYIVKIAAMYSVDEDKNKRTCDSYFLKTGLNEVTNFNEFIIEKLQEIRSLGRNVFMSKRSFLRKKFNDMINFNKFIFLDDEDDECCVIDDEEEFEFDTDLNFLDMNEEVIGKAVEKDIKEIDDLDELINTKFKFLKNNKKFSQILEQFSEPITLMALKEEGKQVEHYLESTMQFDSDYHKANVFVGSSMFLSALCRCSDVYFEKHGFFIEDF
jgi:hypothetical protein